MENHAVDIPAIWSAIWPFSVAVPIESSRIAHHFQSVHSELAETSARGFGVFIAVSLVSLRLSSNAVAILPLGRILTKDLEN